MNAFDKLQAAHDGDSPPEDDEIGGTQTYHIVAYVKRDNILGFTSGSVRYAVGDCVGAEVAWERANKNRFREILGVQAYTSTELRELADNLDRDDEA